MAIPFNAATTAYGNASRLITEMGKGGQGAASASGQGPDFAQLLAQTVQGVVDSGRNSDALTMEMVNGRANVVDVVTAISQTELAVESLVTVRDRVISAYEEIMRMPI